MLRRISFSVRIIRILIILQMSWKLRCLTFPLLFFLIASITGNVSGDVVPSPSSGGVGNSSNAGGGSGDNPCIPLACTGKGQGNFSDPKNCSQYYQCTGKANPHVEICQPGMPYFDQNSNTCTDDPLMCCQNSLSSLGELTTVAKTEPLVTSLPGGIATTAAASATTSTISVAPISSTSLPRTESATKSTVATGDGATYATPTTTATTVEPISSTTAVASTSTAMAAPTSTTTTTTTTTTTNVGTTTTVSSTISRNLLFLAPSDGSSTGGATASSTTAVSSATISFDVRVLQSSTSASSLAFQRQISIAPSSGKWIEGTALTFSCSYVWVSGLFVAHVENFQWFLNGNTLDTTGRITIEQPAKPADNNYWTSTITFHPVLYTDSGNLSCYVFTGGNIANSTSILTQVLAKPVVSIFPFVQTIYKGNQTTLNCTAFVATTKFSPISDNLTVIWFRDNILQDPNTAGNSIVFVESLNRLVSSFSITPANISNYSCLAINSAGNVSSSVAIIRILSNVNMSVCESESFDGVVWSLTQPGNDDVEMCPNGDTGVATRQCSLDASWKNPDFDNCVAQKYTDFQNEVFQIRDRNSVLDNSTMGRLAEDVLQLTENSTDMTSSELNLTVYSIYTMADVRKNGNIDVPVQKQELTDVLKAISNLLDVHSWSRVSPNLAVQLLTSMNWYSEVYTGQQKTDQNEPVHMVNGHGVIQSDGIRLDADISEKNFHFPNWTMVDEEDIENESISLSGKTILQIGNYLSSEPGDTIFYYTSCINKLGEFFPITDAQMQNNVTINSPIISLTFVGLDSDENLSPPIIISAQHLQVNTDSNLTGKCYFWNFTSPESGSWLDDGCQTMSSNATHTICNCSHLTNFAILMSPSPATGIDALILSIISEIGCIISIISLALTILLYVFRWKTMKSKRAAILINLCIALIIANIVFLAGSDKTQDQIGCKVVAALLHYFFLVSFFMMLLEGVMLVVYIICVFHVVRKSETVGLIVAAWVIPAVIVGVSLGVTKTIGYGTDTTCWLSIQDGVLWAFVGPALFVIFVNLIIIVIVLVRIANARVRSNIKRKRNKILSLLRNIVIISPILGVTWVFGVLSVNQSLVAFQYIFAIANSLQGLFIFLLHGLCHSKNSSKSANKQQLAPNWVQSPSRGSQGPLDQLGIAMSETDSQEDLIKVSTTAKREMRAEAEIQGNLSIQRMPFAVRQLSNTSHASTGTRLTYVSNSSTLNGTSGHNGQPCASFVPLV